MRHQHRWSPCSGWLLVPRPRLHLIRLQGVLAPNLNAGGESVQMDFALLDIPD